MPVSSYYNGKGREVMDKMVSHYGPAKGASVFYATAHKSTKKVRKPPSTASTRKLLVRPSGGSRVPSNIRKHNRQMRRYEHHPRTPYVSGSERYNA